MRPARSNLKTQPVFMLGKTHSSGAICIAMRRRKSGIVMRQIESRRAHAEHREPKMCRRKRG